MDGRFKIIPQIEDILNRYRGTYEMPSTTGILPTGTSTPSLSLNRLTSDEPVVPVPTADRGSAINKLFRGVNTAADLLRASPILGDILRSTYGNLAETRGKWGLEIAREKGRQSALDDIMAAQQKEGERNARLWSDIIGAEGRLGAERIKSGSAKEVERMRGEREEKIAGMEAGEKRRSRWETDLTDLVLKYGELGDASKALADARIKDLAKKLGMSLPEAATPEQKQNWWAQLWNWAKGKVAGSAGVSTGAAGGMEAFWK